MDICLIPARIGSKRIPKKNIKLFNGKPIITYPIEVAKESKFFDKIVVFSDSQEIKEVVEPLGVEFFNRNNVSDTQTTAEMLVDFLEKYPDKDIKTVTILYPTALFINRALLVSLTNIIENNYDVAFTTIKYPHPVQRRFEYFEGELKMVHPEYMFSRTQDCKESFFDAGQAYTLNVKEFLKEKKIFLNRMISFNIKAIDIDTEEDWKRAEEYFMCKRRKYE